MVVLNSVPANITRLNRTPRPAYSPPRLPRAASIATSGALTRQRHQPTRASGQRPLPTCQPALPDRRMFSARRRLPPDRREPGHLLQITQVHVVTDVAAGRIIGRGEIPPGVHAGGERPGGRQTPPLGH